MLTGGEPGDEVERPARPALGHRGGRLAHPVHDDRPDHGEGAGQPHGEHRHPVQEQGQRGEHDDEHAEVGQHDVDLRVDRLEQHAEHDQDEAALRVVEQEPRRRGPALGEPHPHRDADDHREQRRREVLRDVEHAAHRAQVRHQHRHDREPAGGVEAVEARGRRHGPSLPVESGTPAS